MKFIFIFVVIVIIINVTTAKNLLDIFLEYRNINRDFSKAKPPSYIIVKRRTIGLFPSLPNRQNKFMVDSKPPTETHSSVAMSEQYKQLLMRELSMKDVNYKDKMKTEVTTRRPFMQMRKYTVRPHDVHAESVREKYNWNSNRKYLNKATHNRERNIGKTNNKIIDRRKSKTTLLFPKRNNTKYLKGNPEKSVSKKLQINNFVSEKKVPFNVTSNSNNGIVDEKENVTPLNVFIKSDLKNRKDKIIKPKEESFLDQDELIPVKASDMPFVEPHVADDDEMTTDSDIEYLVSRNKRHSLSGVSDEVSWSARSTCCKHFPWSFNVIEEERVAPTLSGVKVTIQDYPVSHDLTFNNIHT